MDFKDTTEETRWREQVRGFLQAELPSVRAAMRGNREWLAAAEGERPDTRARAGSETRERMSEGMKAWRQKLRDKGWIAPAWPAEYGGGGLSVKQQFILNEEFAEARAPAVGGMGISMVGPTLMAHGTEEQKAEYLPQIIAGKANWCQGFSEPGAGSDLASLQTKAVLDGDDFVVNGQKV
jgi:alkylation response protein AidB-like acyl-CoA dehydrogenase